MSEGKKLVSVEGLRKADADKLHVLTSDVLRTPLVRLDPVTLCDLLALSALDPLNMIGTVLGGRKIPRQLGARVLYRDGIALATLSAGEMEMLAPVSMVDEHAVRKALLREPDSQSMASAEIHPNA